MKTRLDQLTLRDLIELSCGDSTVLLDKDESITDAALNICVRQIMNEYKEIASPAKAKMDMIEAEELHKLRIKEKCLQICLVLISQKRLAMVKDVLLELAVSEEHLKTDEAIELRCKALLDETKYEIRRQAELAEEKGAKKQQSSTEIRKSWYGEIAFTMSTLKMSIDPDNTNAAIYANLVRQAVERNKALAKIPPMVGMFM